MKAHTYLFSVLGLSLFLSGYSVLLAFKEASVGEGLSAAWILAFAFLVALWARADAATQKVHRTLDFSFYFLAMWPLALPYYLVKTRGPEGVIYFIGFTAIHFAPFLFGLIAYSCWVAQ